jgi:DNA-directed RNA polymerase subunit RPC12/RpoP
MDWIRSLLEFFYDVIFGCRHVRQTRPFTLEQQTYKVCLDCGHKIFYSRERMSPLSAREVRRMRAAEAGILTVVPASAPSAMLVQGSTGKSNVAA